MEPMEITSTSPEIPWELDDVLGKGRFATAFIPRGTRIMVWKPTITSDEATPGSDSADENGDPDKVVWNFYKAILINHACDNNAYHSWNDNNRCFTLHAGRDIHKGDEITTNFLALSGPLPCDERRKLLHYEFNFWCRCRLCSVPEAITLELDRLLLNLHDIRKAIFNMAPRNLTVTSPTPTRAQLYQMVQYFLALVNEQGANNKDMANIFYAASVAMFAAGDMARGTVYARRALQEVIVYEGDDSCDYKDARILVDQPASHPLFRADAILGMVKQTNMDDIPTGLAPQFLNHWLWGPVPDVFDVDSLRPNHGPLSEDELAPRSSLGSLMESGVYITVQPDVVTDLRNTATFPVFCGLPHEMGLHLSPFHVSTRPRRVIIRTNRRVGGEVTRARSRVGSASPRNRPSPTAKHRPASSNTMARGSRDGSSSSGTVSQPATPPPPAEGHWPNTAPGMGMGMDMDVGISQPTTRQFLGQLQRIDKTRPTYRLKGHYALIGEITAVVDLSRLELYVKDLSGRQFPVSFWTSRKGAEFSQNDLNHCVGRAIVLLYPQRSTSVFRFRESGVKVWDMNKVKVLPISLAKLMDLNDKIQEYSAIDLVDASRKCHGCGIRKRGLLCCAACNMFWYCSETCQHRAWNEGHMTDCRNLRKRDVMGMFMFDWDNFRVGDSKVARFPLKHRTLAIGEVVNGQEF